VCDLETSRMGAPYIYYISRLRVKYLKPSRGPFSNHWKITDLFLWKESCSVCEKWLHENCTALFKTCIRGRHYKCSRNFENWMKLLLRALFVMLNTNNFISLQFYLWHFITFYFISFGPSFTTPSAKDAPLHTFTIFIAVSTRSSISHKRSDCITL